jgi:DNA sulfur modification protein DndD
MGGREVRIERIDLKNYRQFRNVCIDFGKSQKEDLHIIIADNGTGKTNLLNAINWCLYGNEPHLSKDSQQLPRLNLNTLVQSIEGTKQTVSVELVTETEGNRITFKRSEEYLVHKDKKQPVLHDINFTVTYLDDKKNAKWVIDEEATAYVERFVPRDIREFFFFDGERLDTYFKSATGQQISNAIFRISQVDALNRISERLENVVNDLKREAGKRSPQIEEIREAIEEKEKNRKEILNQIAELGTQKEEARGKIDELNERLRNIPNVDALQAEQTRLRDTSKKKEQVRNEKVTEKQNMLFELGILLKLYPVLHTPSQIINHKIESKELPLTYDTRLLDNILSMRYCICKRRVEEGSSEENQIKQLRADIASSSAVAQQLQQMIGPIEQIKKKISTFKSSLEKITKEIQLYEEELNDINSKIQSIDSQIGGYNVEQVKQWYSELKDYQRICDLNIERIANLKMARERFDKEIADLNQDLNKALLKEAVLQEVRHQIAFGKGASEVVNNVVKTMMDRVRKAIEHETRDNFFNLVWKKETFKDVYIDENYALHLIHGLGYECLGSVSASERQLLALSFVIALHNVSGFDSPILVDTPVARVSNEQRENLGKTFYQISRNKQLILLFLPTEYSLEISQNLDACASSMRKLRLTEDEREIQMEVLR